MLATTLSLPTLADEPVAGNGGGSSNASSAKPADVPDNPEDIGKRNRGLMIKVIEPGKPSVTTEKKPAQQSKPTHKTETKSMSKAGSGEHKATGNKTETKTAAETKPAIHETKVVHTTTTTKTAKQEAVTTTKTAVVKPSKGNRSNSIMKTLETAGAHNVVPVKNTTNVVATKTANQTHSKSVSDDQIVTAWLNKPGDRPKYKDGEKLQVNVSANKDCNVLIFNYDGNMLTQLFPNEYQASPLVKAGQTVAVGGEQSKFDFTASNDGSKATSEKIFVYAYPVDSDSAPISVAMAPIPQTPFRGTEFTPEQYRELVNQSKAFTSRRVKVTGRSQTTELVSYTSDSGNAAAPNKIELGLSVESKH